MSSPEVAPQGPENNEAPKDTVEQYDKLREKIENGAELGVESGEQAAEKAKVEALENAVSVEKGGAEKAAKQPKEGPAPAKRRGKISTKEKEVAFKKHISHAQSEMSAPARAFSKLIHARAVEKTSEVVGATVARPNAILSGAIFAFILVLVVYLIAKNYGYVLSGFETIGAFVIGWILGMLYDFLRVMITGKKS